MEINNTRCRKTLIKFIEYMNNNPDQRFFQGVRNLFGIGFLVADGVDTFYKETDDMIWGTLDDKMLFMHEINDQHLSNIHHFLESRGGVNKAIEAEISRRRKAGFEILPYKPYYDEETEKKILKKKSKKGSE